MSVTTRYMSSQIGPNGFQSWIALALANGQLALLGPPGGIPSVDYPTSYALWNPTTNSLSICDTVACGGGSISAFTTSADRTKLLTNGINEIDVATGQVISTSATVGQYQILTTPDGKYVVAYGVNDNVFVYDAQTLAQVAEFAVQGDGSGLAVSVDSSTLYTCGSGHGGFVYAYGIPNGNAVGWVPDIVVLPQEGGLGSGRSTSHTFWPGIAQVFLPGRSKKGLALSTSLLCKLDQGLLNSRMDICPRRPVRHQEAPSRRTLIRIRLVV